jgi:hypothetical protein
MFRWVAGCLVGWLAIENEFVELNADFCCFEEIWVPF